MSKYATTRGIRGETGMSNTRLVFIRHGESQVAVRRILGGPRSCTGLSPLGRRQAQHLRDRFLSSGEIQADVIISSGYPRALETANIVSPGLGSLPVQVDTAWGEHDPGPECDGMKYEDFVKRFGHVDWSGDPYGVTFRGGETVAQFSHRVRGAIFTTINKYEGKTVVVFCHGGVIDASLRCALNVPVVGGFDIFTLNTSVTEIVHTGTNKWQLHRYNDSAHLAGLPPSTLIHSEPSGK
ncbi:MAG: histidine phosphatase family protein [Ilumatobacteraceae bacterium]|nr:histidine phosphatase family protein [Ilumatobacteraceae bacterium]